MPPDGRPVFRTFECTEVAETERCIEDKQGTHNWYFAVNRIKPSAYNRKAKKSDIEAVLWLHVDIDNLDALKRILAYDILPTVTIFSGGGYQCFYRLATPTTDFDLAERCNRALARALGGDNCHNVDRVMRVPFTVNVPNAKKRAAGRVPTVSYIVEEATDWSRQYDIAIFAEETATAATAVSPASQPCDVLPKAIAELSVTVTDTVRSLIEKGDDELAPMGTPGARYPSRSEVVFRVACDLARAGCSDAEIAGILLNSDYGISSSVLEKQQSKKYALKQAQSALATIGTGWPDMAKFGPRPTLRNTLLAIRRLGLHCENDEFHRRKKIGGHALQAFQGELSDDGCAVLRHMILERFRFDPGKDHTREAANTLCLENSFHPIRDYLDRLHWDGQGRIELWLTAYLGAEDTPLNRAIGRIMLVAAVRRIRQTGCKFDNIVIFEGSQGTGKSTAIRILAGDENFSDQDILTLDPKAQMEAVEGVWLYELGELEGLSRADMSKVKAFASRLVDQARPAYGRFRETRPRQNIFIGTTNDDQYLRDRTGNRRFWPVATGTIDLEALRQDRDQLWAEASALEARGESIVLAEELWPAAKDQQDARMEDDPWLDRLQNIGIDSDMEAHDFMDWKLLPSDGSYKVSTADIFQHVLKMEPSNVQSWHNKRLAQLMRNIGWDGPKNMKFGQRVMRGYTIAETKLALIWDPDHDRPN